MKSLINSFSLITLLIIILLFPSLAFDGAKSGLLLWFNMLVPSLFPFMILSNMIISMNATYIISFLVYPLFGRLLGISKNGCYAATIGFLCGYPMGAKVINDLLQNKRISIKEAKHLILFCNNCGPAFMWGYLLNNVLPDNQYAYILILSIYGSPFLIAIFANFFLRYTDKEMYETKKSESKLINLDFGIIDKCIWNALEVILKLGGYIIIFSLIGHILFNTLHINPIIKSVLIGILEITTGSDYISTFVISEKMQIILLSVILSFGGLCTMFQSGRMIKSSSLSLIRYSAAKLINTAISFLICVILLSFK